MSVPESDSVQLYIRLRSRTDGAWLAPPDLRQRLIADAEEQDANMNQIATGILARHFNIDYSGNGGTPRRHADPDRCELNLEVPAALRDALDLARIGTKKTAQQLALSVLCAHYGLRLPAPAVRPRSRRSPQAV